MSSYMLPFIIISVGIYIAFILFKNTPSHITILIAVITILVITVPAAILIDKNNNKAFIKANNCTLQSIERGMFYDTPTYICNDGKTHTQ